MERIKELREKQGLGQSRLAVLTDIPVNSLANLERKWPMTLDRIETIAHVLGVSPTYLCEWDDDKRERVAVRGKVVEKVVVKTVYREAERLPRCWQSENNQIIQWRERQRRL